MPALTIYLSRLIGVVMLIVAAAMLADKAVVVAAVEHLGQDRTSLLMLGFVRVVLGACIVLVHNIWRRGLWPLVVTLTGWAMLARGVMNLFLPPEIMGSLFAAAHVDEFYYLYAGIPLVVGFYLCLRGFSVPAPPIQVAAAPMPLSPPAAAAPKPPPPKARPRRRR